MITASSSSPLVEGSAWSAPPRRPTGSAPIIRHATVHVFAAAATAILLSGKVAPTTIIAWLATIALTQFYCCRTEQSTHDRTPPSLLPLYVGAALSALAWAFPLWAFGSQVGTETAIRLWAVLALLMAGSVFRASGMPGTALVFSVLLGISGGGWFLFAADPGMATNALLFVAITSAAIVERKRSSGSAREGDAPTMPDTGTALEPPCELGPSAAHWHWQTDAALHLHRVSAPFALAAGRRSSQMEGVSLRRLIGGTSSRDAPCELTERMKRREDLCNFAVRVVIDGQARWWELSGRPYHREDSFVGYRGTGRDVTESRESLERMTRMAHYDALTGLPNRAKLTEVLVSALNRAAQEPRNTCAFLMIDVDRFKAVNDTLGHDVGDALLVRIAERLREQIADTDLCGRFSGNAFAVIIPGASDLDRVRLLVRRITDRLIQPYEINQHTVLVGASIGWAIGPQDGSTAETIMRNAGLALYRAKEARDNSHCRYERGLHAQAEERRKLEIALRRAIKRGELHLAFQPVVDARSEAIVGFEALLRWQSTEHGTVSPERFIPLAEETRLIVPIGEWVLHEACKEAANWRGDVRIAVNVSGEQLLDANFVASVGSALAASGLAAERLEIEVTESIFLSDAPRACAALEHVMSLGCTVALDDFGTGYSSLGYLRRIRFSAIKLDRSFVQGAAGGSRECLAILQAVVTMADSLGITTTAEGVETRKEVDFVRTLGCRKIQGYYFGKPRDAHAARALFEMT